MRAVRPCDVGRGRDGGDKEDDVVTSRRCRGRSITRGKDRPYSNEGHLSPPPPPLESPTLEFCSAADIRSRELKREERAGNER